MVTASEHEDIDTIESIVLGEGNDMKDNVGFCEYGSNTLQQKPFLVLHGIGNVILKDDLEIRRNM